MTKLAWDQLGEKIFESGVDHGVLYPGSTDGTYPEGFAWNGLTSVTESPSGAEPNKQYADNQVYVNMLSAEEFSGTIEAFTYPDEFAECDGSLEPVPGLTVGQQPRKPFGLSYRTKVGNDTVGQDFGYKIHMIWGATAAPTEKAYTTVNDSPEAATFSWSLSTTPTAINLEGFRPTALIVVDSTKLAPNLLKELEDLLYGTAATEAELPSPTEVIQLIAPGVGAGTP